MATSKRVLIKDANDNQVMPITDAKNVYVSEGVTVYDMLINLQERVQALEGNGN